MALDSGVLNAIATLIAPSIPVAVGALFIWRATKAATTASIAAQKATAQFASEAASAAYHAQQATAQAAYDASQAQATASTASAQASEAARQLIITARESNAKLDQIAEVGTATHKIVNNQRTVMMNALATALEKIAILLPHDEPAQLAAKNARTDADASRS
jgi:hypothetical protein